MDKLFKSSIKRNRANSRVTSRGRAPSSFFGTFLASGKEKKFATQLAKLEEVYKLDLPALGKGAFGRVYRAYKLEELDKSIKVPVAVKEIEKTTLTKDQLTALNYEVSALAKLRHPNIISFLERYDSNAKLCIVMEYIDGETLQETIRKDSSSEEFTSKVIYQIALALDHCKRRGIVHRDIKPANIILTFDARDNPLVKLIDFGFSVIIDKKVHSGEEKNLVEWVGTLHYISPEIVHKQVYNYKTDFWSLGVIMFEMLCGRKPFEMKQERRAKALLMERIGTGVYEFLPESIWMNISDDAKDLISHLLEIKPDERYGTKETLEHIFLAKEHEKMLATKANFAKYSRKKALEYRSGNMKDSNTSLLTSSFIRRDSDEVEDEIKSQDSLAAKMIKFDIAVETIRCAHIFQEIIRAGDSKRKPDVSKRRREVRSQDFGGIDFL